MLLDLLPILLLGGVAYWSTYQWGRSLRRERALLEENLALLRLLAAETEDERLEAWTAFQCAHDKQKRLLYGRKR